jgi:hypothetical protein
MGSQLHVDMAGWSLAALQRQMWAAAAVSRFPLPTIKHQQAATNETLPTRTMLITLL